MDEQPSDAPYNADEAAYLRAAREHLSRIRAVIPDAEIFSVALGERLFLRGLLTVDETLHAWRESDPATTVVVWSESRGRLERVDVGHRA